jgi:hypothetical protein
MTKASLTVGFLLILWLCPAAVSAQATDAQAEAKMQEKAVLQFGMLYAGMSFSEMRSALPDKRWVSASYDDLGLVPTREIYAEDALDWTGRRFRVSYQRTGYPSSVLKIAAILPAKNRAQCEMAVSALADDASIALSLAPSEWSDQSPTKFGRHSTLRSGFERTQTFSGILPFGYPEAIASDGADSTSGGLHLTRASLKDNFRKGTVTIWRSYAMRAGTLVKFFARHHSSFDDSGLPGCFVTLSLHMSREADEEPPPAIEIAATQEDIFANMSDANKVLIAEEGIPVPPAAGGSYRCKLGLLTGGLLDCQRSIKDMRMPEAVEPTPEKEIDRYVAFLEKHGRIKLDLAEEDLTERWVTIPAVKIPIELSESPVTWEDAKLSHNEIGLSGFNASRLVRPDEFPTSLFTNADIDFLCKVMSDLSVYCGEQRVSPVEKSGLFGSLRKKLAARAAKQYVKPKLADGGDAKGRYFIVRAKFRIPE